MNFIQLYFILKIWFLIFLCGVKQSNVLFKGKVYKGINPTETVINLWILNIKKGQNNFLESFYTFAGCTEFWS